MGSGKENKYVNEPHQREFYYLKYDLSQMALYLGRLLESSTQFTSVLKRGLEHPCLFSQPLTDLTVALQKIKYSCSVDVWACSFLSASKEVNQGEEKEMSKYFMPQEH